MLVPRHYQKTKEWMVPQLLEKSFHSLAYEITQPVKTNHNSFHGTCPMIVYTLWSVLLSAAAAVAKSLQSCPTLCDPMDCSLPGFSVHGILQARTLEWVAISFSKKVLLSHFSHVRLCATPWTAAYQASQSMGFSRQKHWSGLPFPSPRASLTASK